MCKPIKVAGIVNDSITDGPGLRLTVFVQGCDKRCKDCHNPSAQAFEGGEPMEADEILTMVMKNPLLSGVTLSGGEPFCQAEALVPLAQKIKRAGFELAAYTGNVLEEMLDRKDENINELISMCDVIVDGPFITEKRNLMLKFRGSENQRIIDVSKTLEAGEVVLDESERWN